MVIEIWGTKGHVAWEGIAAMAGLRIGGLWKDRCVDQKRVGERLYIPYGRNPAHCDIPTTFRLELNNHPVLNLNHHTIADSCLHCQSWERSPNIQHSHSQEVRCLRVIEVRLNWQSFLRRKLLYFV